MYATSHSFSSYLIQSQFVIPLLPLRRLASHKVLQDRHPLFQRSQPLLHFALALDRVVVQLRVEVLSVRCRRHGRGKDRLDQEAVVWLESVAVGMAEGDGELFGGVGQVVAEPLGGEVEAAAW